jgi:DNA-binding NarL/FixJ family response regulator
MIRVAVVEKVDYRREGYALLLQQFKHCDVVLQAKSEEELGSKMVKTPIDVVVYYCDATSENHLETIETWQHQHPGLKVLLIPPTFDYDAYTKAFQSKLLGYLKMESTTKQLKKAILGLHRNGYYMDKRVLHQWKTGNDKQQDNTNGKPSDKILTEYELALFCDFITDMSMTETAEKHNIAYVTARSRHWKIIKKIGAKNLASALRKLIVEKKYTLKQLGLQCILAFCFLFSSFDFSDERTSDDWEVNSCYEWVKAG